MISKLNKLFYKCALEIVKIKKNANL